MSSRFFALVVGILSLCSFDTFSDFLFDFASQILAFFSE